MPKSRARGIYLSWIGVALVIVAVVQPLWGLPIKGDDTWLHFYRIPVVSALWREGILFSRWSPNLVLGYGSPLFTFYPPFSAYLLTAVYWLSGQQAPLALNISFALAIALSALSMFLLGRHLFGKGAGLGMAAIYTWSPVLLTQTYARGSLSNALAMAFFPLALLCLIKIADDRGRRWLVWAALAIAGMFLSHIAASLLFVGPLILLGTAYAWIRNRRVVAQVWFAVALGLALSAFAWLPALAEYDLTRYASEAASVDLTRHWATLMSWPQPVIAGLDNAILPKVVGVMPLIMGLAGAVAALRFWRRPAARLSIVSGCLGLIFLWLATPASTFLWQRITYLSQIQFPWRLLDVAVFCLTIAAGALFSFRPKRLMPIWYGVAFSLALVVMYWEALPYLYPPRLAELPQQPTLADVQAVQQTFGIWGLTGWGEYSAQEVGDWPEAPPFSGAAENAPLFSKLRRSALPPASSITATGSLLRAELQVDLPQATSILFETHYFPGWQAEVDGVAATVEANDEGILSIPVAAGQHEIVIWFGRTPIRVVADGLTLAAALVAVAVLLRKPTARRQTGPVRAISGRAVLVPVTLTLVFLLVAKIVLLDQFNNRFVSHPTAAAVPDTTVPENGNFGDIALIGYELEAPDQLTLYWAAQATLDRLYHVQVQLSDARGVPIAVIINPRPGKNATTTWESGLLTRDRYTLPLDRGDRPVGYTISVALLDAATGEPLPLLDSPDIAATRIWLATTSELIKLPPARDLPAVLSDYPDIEPDGTVFGEAIALSHQTLSVSDDLLDLTLVWRSIALVPANYNVFVHILYPDGSLAVTGDGPPMEGVYPTSYWAPGEIIVDRHLIPLHLPPGEYRLEVGLYELASGDRLPATASHSILPDRVFLGTLLLGKQVSE